MPMNASKPRADIAGMSAILLHTIRNELLTAGSAFRILGSSAHIPMIMPPTQAAGVRAELFLFPAGGMYQCSAALSASDV